MTTALDIHFHGLEKSEAIEAKVKEKVAKLQRHFRKHGPRLGVATATGGGESSPSG